MNVPSGYTELDLIGFTDKGDYSSSATYVKNDIVTYNNSKWRCLIDDTSGVTPAEGVNWTIFMESASSFAGMTDTDINSPSDGQIPVYDATAGKWKNVSPDSAPTSGSDTPVTSGGVHSALEGKQDTLTFDNAPTQNSTNPVKSGGVYSALEGKQDTLTFDNAPTQNSNNPVKSGGVYSSVKAVSDALAALGLSVVNGKLCVTFTE